MHPVSKYMPIVSATKFMAMFLAILNLLCYYYYGSEDAKG